ncbi:MAG: DedA family protein [Bacteroidales bacterium]|nr:DedA family protein [Bacteroidales bacterium]
MELIHTVVDWYMANLSYLTVFLLMVIESSFIPFPSEVVIPFAAYKAAEGGMNVFGVVIAGTLGAVAGALINYYLSKYLGRPIVYKLAGSKVGRLLLLSEKKVEHAEDYFNRNGNTSTFIGRLVPAVRQLISIPAGLARMNIRNFIIYTTAGAAIWNIILAVIGYFAYEIKDRILPYLDDVLIAIGAGFIIYLTVKALRNRKKAGEK